ncbi:HAD domain-containing protein [Herbidospora sp. RD11066]
MPDDLPILFLDVDGPIIPFGGHHPPRTTIQGANPLLSRIDPTLGEKLAALPVTLVWATTWTSEANDVIAPLLGLPDLPYVDWPDTDTWGELHWKTAHLVTWANGRDFIWLDDEPTDLDRRWITRHHPARALVHQVNPTQGITDEDLQTVRSWPARLPGKPRPAAPAPDQPR